MTAQSHAKQSSHFVDGISPFDANPDFIHAPHSASLQLGLHAPEKTASLEALKLKATPPQDLGGVPHKHLAAGGCAARHSAVLRGGTLDRLVCKGLSFAASSPRPLVLVEERPGM